MIFGYGRVNSKNQNFSRQLGELQEYGCEQIYSEKQIEKGFNRPLYKEMRSKMKIGDVLVLHDLSGFGRNKKQIKEGWEALIKEEIDIVVLDVPILDTRKYKGYEADKHLVSELVLTLLSWMVEEERTRTRAAQREEIEIAKKLGKFKGGKKKYHKNATGKDKVIYDNVVRFLKENVSEIDIHPKTGVARNTIYSIKSEIEIN